MTVTIDPVGATLGAVVRDVRLADLSEGDWEVIDEALDRFGVLIFPDQAPSLEEQIGFAQRFGELDRYDERSPHYPGNVGDPVIAKISNVDKQGAHLTDRTHPQVRQMSGNESWHSDSSFKPRGAKVSVVAALEVPTEGGQTEFADMRSAYAQLDEETKSRLAPLEAWHSIVYSRAQSGAIEKGLPDDPRTAPGARHRVIQRSGRLGLPSLLLGAHACYIYGMDVAEGQSLVRGLVSSACAGPRVYSHTWRVGDLVVWDNRWVLHRGRSWDLSERRVLQHVRIAGDEGAIDHAGVA